MPALPAAAVPEQRVAAVRRFTRFYTRRIGVLHEHLLDSPFSLTAGRVLYELAQWPERSRPTAAALAAKLDVDEGYLSRILLGFTQRGLVRKGRHAADSRQKLLELTTQGRRAFALLDARSRAEVAAMLAPIAAPEQHRLVGAMQIIEDLLGGSEADSQAKAVPYELRAHRPGDMGWVIHRHGALYAQEYGYDEHFEALVAQIAAHFIEHFDRDRERCWIAEMDAEIVGSVFLVRKNATTAKLRLLLVEPRARGLGIGARLVEECVRFARAAGYRKLVLWTQSELSAARRVYERAGFKRVRAEPHRSFGKKLVAETWQLAL
jgi:DNA-binding MarR family transcriptional regulator/N-acetylglutamate synthase-like GNAT family acetyltransferase